MQILYISTNTFAIKYYILRLDIPMYNPLPMQILQSQQDRPDHKLNLSLGKNRHLRDMIPQISTLHQIHQNVQILFILECRYHVYKVFVFQSGEELSLVYYRIHASFCYHSILMIIYMALLIYFMAYILPVFKCYTFHTLPNPPLPIILTYLNYFLLIPIPTTYFFF